MTVRTVGWQGLMRTPLDTQAAIVIDNVPIAADALF
jgi:hypothetical protein